MAYTAFTSPTHFLTEEIDMPTHEDELGGGAKAFRRQQTRALRRWELNIPARHEGMDGFIGLLEMVQGDTPIFFDGAGMLEVVEPILIAVGDGTTTDIILPHRFVFVSSVIVYLNGGVFNAWAPLGDGITMDSLRFDSAIPNDGIVTAKYRRKAKTVLRTEDIGRRERVLRFQDNEAKSIYRSRLVLQEVAV